MYQKTYLSTFVILFVWCLLKDLCLQLHGPVLVLSHLLPTATTSSVSSPGSHVHDRQRPSNTGKRILIKAIVRPIIHDHKYGGSISKDISLFSIVFELNF